MSKEVKAPPKQNIEGVNLDTCEEVSLDSLNTIDDGNAELERHIAADELGEEIECEETLIDD